MGEEKELEREREPLSLPKEEKSESSPTGVMLEGLTMAWRLRTAGGDERLAKKHEKKSLKNGGSIPFS